MNLLNKLKKIIKFLSSSKQLSLATIVIIIYTFVALASKFGLLASKWDISLAKSYEEPGIKYLFGADIFGRSVLLKIIKSTETAISVGVISTLITVFIGTGLGVCAGFYGGFVDSIVVFLYTVVSSIPNIMLLISLGFILGKGNSTIYIALGLTSWPTLCQIIRLETMRHKDREYINAATAIGCSNIRKIFKHILPNISHIILIRAALIFQFSVKSEVILSYLGFGSQDKPSWGKMIYEAGTEIMKGVWWQLVFSTAAMFFIVLALNTLSDGLRDALDPKLKNR